ncbi:MAG: hypothetical protein ABSD03_00380 [Vulcanimicrobiaceae bacterium]
MPDSDLSSFDVATAAAARPAETAQPATLNVQINPTSLPNARYPEQSNPRFSAAAGRWGACFSGGGPRSCAASLGQMRGLVAAGAFSRVGAISCVSGGSWFGSVFTYATQYTDAQLLGTYLEPGAITLANIASVPSECIGSGLLNMTNTALVAVAAIEYLLGTPADKIWSRLMNAALLFPFGAGSTETYLALDATTVDAIVARNPNLTPGSFVTQRPDRPFFIAGGTHIAVAPTVSPTGDLGARPGTDVAFQLATQAVADLPGQYYEQFEYTASYAGDQQFSTNRGPFGGGFVENVGFAQQAPTAPPRGDIVSVATNKYRFLLSDVIGSSSSAFASVAVEIGIKAAAPQFDYFSPQRAGSDPGRIVTIGDGGILENVGIVPLLHRGYRVIFAFVNSAYPVGSLDSGCVDGIDGQISRLFGFIPPNDFGNSQNTQIFPSAQWPAVAAGLKRARAAGGPVVFADTYSVVPNNPFGIPPYPNGGTVQVFWLYNDLNQRWYDALQAPVQNAIQDRSAQYALWNLPAFYTVFQNPPSLLWYSPEQVNLLAHMWAYSVKTGFANPAEPFGIPFSEEAATAR